MHMLLSTNKPTNHNDTNTFVKHAAIKVIILRPLFNRPFLSVLGIEPTQLARCCILFSLTLSLSTPPPLSHLPLPP